MTLEEFTNFLIEVQKNIANIEINYSATTTEPNGTIDFDLFKNKFSEESGKLLAPIIYNFVTEKANEIATKISNDAISPLLERIRVLETQ